MYYGPPVPYGAVGAPPPGAGASPPSTMHGMVPAPPPLAPMHAMHDAPPPPLGVPHDAVARPPPMPAAMPAMVPAAPAPGPHASAPASGPPAPAPGPPAAAAAPAPTSSEEPRAEAASAGADASVVPAGPTPTVYLATYSSVPVYEITVRGIALMRRRSDGFLNATQILKIAGIEKARRTRILEKEILTGEHDKVQGGYGTFQGTWIPRYRAQELAMNYSVYHLIRPLLEFDPAASHAVTASLVKRRGEAPAPGSPRPQQPRFLTLRPREAPAPLNAGGLVHALPADQPPQAPGVPPGSHPTQRSALNAYAVHGYTPQGVQLPECNASSTGDAVHDLNTLSSHPLRSAAAPEEAAGPRFADKAVPPHMGDERERRMREQLTGLFVDSDASNRMAGSPVEQLQAMLSELGGGEPRRGRSPLNLVIDDHGHTALHWASALCRLPLVRMLTALPPSAGGANIYVGNYAGETALHRSVLVTNAYEVSQFPELLDLLAGSLETRDHRKRTVLHHIALVAGLKGRAAPARYYLGCVLERLAPQHGLLDAQDDEGETALSIAARLGNTNMIQMLLDAGARKDLPNYLGITPLDWGISAETAPRALHELAAVRPADVVRSLLRPPPGPVKKSQDVREKLLQTLDELQSIFDREVETKQSAIETTQVHLQAATRELAARRRDIAAAQAAVTEREEARQRCENLSRAIAAATGGAPVEGVPAWTDAPLNEAAAALQGSGDATALAAAVVRVRWLLERCDTERHALDADTQEQGRRAAERERRYRRVVAMCAQVPAERVDGMLDELLAAVESIGADASMHSVASFMHKVGRADARADMSVDSAPSPSPRAAADEART